LVLVVFKNYSKLDVVLTVVANICDVVRASVKSRDVLQEAQDVEIPKGLE